MRAGRWGAEMSQLATTLGYSVEMEQKELTATTTLYFVGGLFFLHRAYLGDYRPTALAVCIALFFLAAFGLFPGVLVLKWLSLLAMLVWIAWVGLDAGRLPKLVDRANADILEKFK